MADIDMAAAVPGEGAGCEGQAPKMEFPEGEEKKDNEPMEEVAKLELKLDPDQLAQDSFDALRTQASGNVSPDNFRSIALEWSKTVMDKWRTAELPVTQTCLSCLSRLLHKACPLLVDMPAAVG